MYPSFNFNSLTKNTDATTAWQLWYHKGHIKPPSKYMFKSREKTEGIKAAKDEIGGQSFKSSSL